jgi:hypothetical protein
VGHHLTLVVGGAAGIEVAVAHRRLERAGDPLIERVGRLHIVVTVDKDGRLAGRTEPLGEHNRVARGWDDLSGQPGAAELIGDVLRGPLGVRGVR